MKTTVNNSEVKIIRKSVKVNVKDDLKYIVIYEVRGVKPSGETITIDRYLDESSAKNHVAFAGEHYKSLYDSVYIYEQWVWC